jgi:hypothetical protein
VEKITAYRSGFFIVFLFFLVTYPCAQSVLQKLPRLVPKGYVILDTAFADMNDDQVADIIMVCKRATEPADKCVLRPVIVALSAGKTWKLHARNDSAVLCRRFAAGDNDPFSGIEVGAGYFSLTHMAGSTWKFTKNITFRFDRGEKTFILVNDEGITYDKNNPGKILPITYEREEGQKFKAYRNNYLR